MPAEDVKSAVKEHYTIIAQGAPGKSTASCCGAGEACCEGSGDVFSEDYSKLEGYVPEADLALGCGIPVDIAGIKQGDTVLDLGSGAGNDVFIARRLVGTKGRVIGVDMTEAMIEKARVNNAKLGYDNVEFRLGDIEDLPMGRNRIDVVISNCVLNLVPDKQQAFAEVFRVLKPGGHFSISDMVLEGELPPAIAADAIMYAGCVAGAIQKEEYLSTIRNAGFTDVCVRREKRSVLPDDVLARYLSPEDARAFREHGPALISITVTGVKPQ